MINMKVFKYVISIVHLKLNLIIVVMLSILGHLEGAILDPETGRVLTLEVHVIKSGCEQVLEVRGVLSHLLLIFLLCNQIDSPTLVKLGDQVNALGVIHSVLFPALD